MLRPQQRGDAPASTRSPEGSTSASRASRGKMGIAGYSRSTCRGARASLDQPAGSPAAAHCLNTMDAWQGSNKARMELLLRWYFSLLGASRYYYVK